MNLLHNLFLQIYVLLLLIVAKQMNRGERFVFNETHLQKIFFQN